MLRLTAAHPQGVHTDYSSAAHQLFRRLLRCRSNPCLKPNIMAGSVQSHRKSFVEILLMMGVAEVFIPYPTPIMTRIDMTTIAMTPAYRTPRQ
jgi:hypothetical protein